MSNFKKYLNQVHTVYDEWSPIMQSELRRTSIKPEIRQKEKTKEMEERKKEIRKTEQIANKYFNKFKDADRFNRDLESIDSDSKRFDDRRKLSKWLEKEFKASLVDVVGDLMYDGMEKNEAIESAFDFDIRGMVQTTDFKKFKRLQELEAKLGWDWEGWLGDVMVDYAHKHVK